MRDRLIELFQELTEEKQQIVLECIEHHHKQKDPGHRNDRDLTGGVVHDRVGLESMVV